MTSDAAPLQPTEAQIAEAASCLDHFEVWCARNNVALSALGRTVVDDQACLYRWRSMGVKGCSQEKRLRLAKYILTHPTGIPGYVKGNSGKKQGQGQRQFVPGSSGQLPSTSREGRLLTTGPSARFPAPSPDLLKVDDFEWVKQRAFTSSQPIAVVLAEMVSLGIRAQREIEYEETQEVQEKPEQQEGNE